jgi:hypothetical protein
MKIVLIILIVIGALATLFVLIRGVVGMVHNTDPTGQRSQTLMRKRIKYQLITILLAVALLAIMSSGAR